MKVGFIGVGWMGYGIASNILKNNHELFVIANKNREPIDKIVKLGAKEVKSYDELCNSKLDALFLCVTNTSIAHEIGKKIVSFLTHATIVIDVTTHNHTGSVEMEKILKENNIPYLECPVMGGPFQAEEGILGGIVGGSEENLKRAEEFLKCFCKDYYHFGGIGNGAKAKLLNNFLSLGNVTFVIETIKAAKNLNIDLKNFFDVSKLGSANSTALNRIFDKLLRDDYTGFMFTASNTLKDLTYISDLLKGMDNAEKLSNLSKSFYKKAVDDGDGELFISELIKKN